MDTKEITPEEFISQNVRGLPFCSCEGRTLLRGIVKDARITDGVLIVDVEQVETASLFDLDTLETQPNLGVDVFKWQACEDFHYGAIESAISISHEEESRYRLLLEYIGEVLIGTQDVTELMPVLQFLR
jgi:hypothetical protein